MLTVSNRKPKVPACLRVLGKVSGAYHLKNRRYQSLVGGYHDYMRGGSAGHVIINRMWSKPG